MIDRVLCKGFSFETFGISILLPCLFSLKKMPHTFDGQIWAPMKSSKTKNKKCKLCFCSWLGELSFKSIVDLNF